MLVEHDGLAEAVQNSAGGSGERGPVVVLFGTAGFIFDPSVGQRMAVGLVARGFYNVNFTNFTFYWTLSSTSPEPLI